MKFRKTRYCNFLDAGEDEAGAEKMSYQVIARKWRPQKFSDMVGQEHIARTLKNTIITGRIAHAYLFVGPRGIGKTTSARIFAKALNCIHPVDGEPCCHCTSCKSIADETNVDVIEIDAATHTQVDKARELCEDVLHLPISSKYKVYIIDEVHMLSKSAWNALLKTIEEPPAHAKFIFATTEVNKVLPTVISRCQRFDLRRIHSSDIAARLRLICDTEHVNISDSAIQVIAQAADGGMRDAQSLLDQLISFFGTDDGSQISEQQALSLFGLTAGVEMEALVRAVLSNDRAAAIRSIHSLAEQGKNLEMLYQELLSWLRGILLCRILEKPQDVLEESPERIALFSRLAQGVDSNCVQRLLEGLSASSYLLRDAVNKQVFLESILLKAMRSAHAVQVEDLIARLNQIRNTGELDALNSVVPLYEMPHGQIVTPADSVYAPLRPVSAVPQDHASAAVQEAANAPQADPLPAPAPETQLAREKAAAPVESPRTKETSEGPATPSAPEAMAESANPAPAPENMEKASGESPSSPVSEPQADADDPAAPEEESDGSGEIPAPESNPEDSDLPDEASAREGGPDEFRRPRPGRICDKYASAEELWMTLVGDAGNFLKKTALAASMMEATPDTINGSELTVAFDEDYEQLAGTVVERDIPLLNRRLRDLSGDPGAQLLLVYRHGLATPAQVQQKRTLEELKAQTMLNPFVQKTLELFDGRLADVHDLGETEDSAESAGKCV